MQANALAGGSGPKHSDHGYCVYSTTLKAAEGNIKTRHWRRKIVVKRYYTHAEECVCTGTAAAGVHGVATAAWTWSEQICCLAGQHASRCRVLAHQTNE
jgi:hypothetical protein